jgi:myo-inositol 2-dehydrogenase/D-chiro-inositol 1-dehydrogenase
MDRRKFLLASAAAPAAFAQAPQSIPTAVIGVGNRGSYLLTAVMAQPVAKVAALCDIKPDRLDKAATAAAAHNPQTYTDWRRIIDRKDIDSVYIATPPHLHSEMAIAALEAGKNVYCEKPIGVTAKQVRDLLKVGRASKKVFVSGQQLRTMRQLMQAVQKIRNGAIGEVIMVKAQRHASTDLNHEGPSADWYFDVTKSGGYLIEQSVHNLDACNWIVGAHPTRAAGFGATLLYKNDPPGRTIFDCGVLSFDYPNGAKMSFTQNVFHARQMPYANQNIFVYGTKGSVDFLYATMMYPLARDGQPTALAEKQEEPRHAHITAFYDSVINGTPSPADITVGATAALTSILGHEAMVKEKVVHWSDLGVDV